MTVTDHEVATLRAALSGNLEEYRALLGSFDRQTDARPYIALVNCAFIGAAERRFGKHLTTEEAVAYVADVRTRTEEAARSLDPLVGERVLLTAVAGGNVQGLDPRAVRGAQQLLLAGLIADEQPDAAELDGLLARARKETDDLLRGTT
jgi:hypothetical protein